MAKEKLKEIRRSLGKNQEQFASQLGITQSYYSALERGEKAITAKLLEKLFTEVGVSSQWWYSSNGDIFSSPNGGKTGGLKGGLANIEHIYQSSVKRFFEELKIEHPELDKLVSNTMLVSDFQQFILEVTADYFLRIWRPGINEESFWIDGKFNYKQFKQTHLQRIKKLEPLYPALEKLKEAIIQFYKDFQPLDSKGIIENYYSQPIDK